MVLSHDGKEIADVSTDIAMWRLNTSNDLDLFRLCSSKQGRDTLLVG